MKYVLMFLVMFSTACLQAEDRSILLVTAKGVWQSDVVNGVPGSFRPVAYDVIVQGLTPGTTPPGAPDPPSSDPQVMQVSTVSKANLKDKAEATAVAAIVNSLSKMGLKGDAFKQALEMSVPIADSSLQADGRITKWAKEALVISSDPAKLIAGLTQAFDISAASLDTIHGAVVAGPGASLPAEAVDWSQIITIIQMIIQLLQNLGII